MTIYSNQLAVNVTTPPIIFRIEPTGSFEMPVSMIRYVVGSPPKDCFYVSDFYPKNPCCNARPNPNGYSFLIMGKIVDSNGKPIPKQLYFIYLLNPDQNIAIRDYYYLYSGVRNPSQNNPVTAQTDSEGNMGIVIFYYRYPNPDQNPDNYPPPESTTKKVCTEGKITSELATSNTIVFQIPGTDIKGQTEISITWKKYYATMTILVLFDCIGQGGVCIVPDIID